MEVYGVAMDGTTDLMTGWARLLRASRTVQDGGEAALKAEGLPPLGWYDVLQELEQAGRGLRPVELERRTLVAQYNLSRLIDRLEKAGLAERRPCPNDARGQMVTITEAGRGIRERMWPVYRSTVERHLGAQLDPGDRFHLSQILGRLLAHGIPQTIDPP
jgi:DNA-binding MarR family transcriptional regulator